jgi:hypothetical protein
MEKVVSFFELMSSIKLANSVKNLRFLNPKFKGLLAQPLYGIKPCGYLMALNPTPPRLSWGIYPKLIKRKKL